MKAVIYRRFRLVAVAAAWLLLCASSSFAADRNGRFFVWYAEKVKSCGSFINARDEGRRGNYLHENGFSDWLASYLTGYNFGAPNTFDIAHGLDADSMMQWLENSCRKKPLQDFSEAAQRLVIELFPQRTTTAPSAG